ncbi:hypothetical protein GGR16_003258 [Chelatococcus caeni]|uniref:Phage head morphogenesis domain-containing protein n=2 Tax=Chelatococcus caeni TaxID=1348468 RepID=A0A840BYL4_9HYPH|nr:hypothetical protein [Chelatococcus caeni]
MAMLQLGGPPPKEVLDYFRSKRLRPGFSWQDVWGQEHAYAFTVAKATEAQVLVAFRGAIDRALSKGLPFEAFQKDITGELHRIGWGGPRVVEDPAGGPPAKVDFTSPRRLNTIFNANMRAARAAGQWERAQRTKGMLPFFLYVESTAKEPRHEHRQWAGTILPVDHPWWDEHFPPNGWGCQCGVRQITKAEAERRGGVAEPPAGRTETFRNRRTGEVTEVPEGVDPGWHTNPGKSRAATLMRRTTEALEEAGPDVARTEIAKIWDSNTPELLAKLPRDVHVPVAVAEEIATALDARGPILALGNRTLGTKVAHPERRLADFALIQRLIDAGRHWPDPKHKIGRVVIGEVGGVWFRLAIGASERERYMYVRTLHPIDERRRAKLEMELEGK